MKASEGKKFVTKYDKLGGLIECVETLDARVKHLEQELRTSDAKAKQSEDKGQRFCRKLKNLQWQMRSLSSDGAGETEWDWCNDDQTDYETPCSSHDSDFGGSIRQSHSNSQLVKLR